MADNLNHSSVDITQELINTNLQLLNPVEESYIIKAKFNNNYSDLFQALGYSLDEISQNDFKIKGRHDLQTFRENSEILGQENIKSMLESNDRQIWDVPYFFDSFAEDNDSEEEEADGEEISDEHVFKEIVDGEKEKFRKWAKPVDINDVSKILAGTNSSKTAVETILLSTNSGKPNLSLKVKAH